MCGSTCTTSRIVSGRGLLLLCHCTISGLMKTSVIMIRKLWMILVPSPLIPGLSSFTCMPVSLWFAGAFVWCMSSGSTFGTIRNFGAISFKMTQQIAVETKAFILLSRLWFTALHLTTICRLGYTLWFFIWNGRLGRWVNIGLNR